MTAFVLWATVLHRLGKPPFSHVDVPWWLLALLFYLAEANVVHVHFRREAHTISLNEIALVIGLFVLPPETPGIGMMPYAKPSFSALASCQVPFSPKA